MNTGTTTPAPGLVSEGGAPTPDATAEVERLAELNAKATGGPDRPWYHCQPFVTVPAQMTVHGRVPAERVDYVSTWPNMGTPAGHRVVINMEGRESCVSSNDMAFISAFVTAYRTGQLVPASLRAQQPTADVGEAVSKAAEPFIGYLGRYTDQRSGNQNTPDQQLVSGTDFTFGDLRRLEAAVAALATPAPRGQAAQPGAGEALAKSLFEAAPLLPTSDPTAWEDAGDEARASYRRKAHAVVAGGAPLKASSAALRHTSKKIEGGAPAVAAVKPGTASVGGRDAE